MCVQYIGGCSVHRGVFSTSGGYHEYIGGISWVHRGMFSTSGGYHDERGGYHEYIGGCSVHRRDTMSTSGDTMSTSGDVQYIGGISWYMWGSNLIKSFQFLLKTPMYWTSPDVLNIPRCTHDIPRCTHDIPPMYSWYPPDVLNIPHVLMVSPHMYHDIPPMYWTSPDVLMISPRCTHGIPPMYWTPPDVLMVSLRCTEHPPDVLMISPRCTHGIPPMYSWYPPDVLNTPRCTEHPPMYWTHIIQGGLKWDSWLKKLEPRSGAKNFLDHSRRVWGTPEILKIMFSKLAEIDFPRITFTKKFKVRNWLDLAGSHEISTHARETNQTSVSVMANPRDLYIKYWFVNNTTESFTSFVLFFLHILKS